MLGSLSALAETTSAVQAHDSTQVLSWEDCVQLAVEKNPAIKASKESLNASIHQKNAAYGLFLPQISGNLSYARSSADLNLGSTLTGQPGFVRDTRDNESYSATISLTQNLFNGFADLGKLNQAKANQTASSAALSIASAKVSFDLKSAFTNLNYAVRSIELSKEIISRRQRNLDLVQLRYESGRENKGSVLLSQANLSQAKLEAIQAENSVGTAQAQLVRALGLDPGTELSVQGQVPTNPPPLKVAFEELALQTPERLQAVAQEESSAAGIRVARGALMPTLGLTGSTGRSDDVFFPQENRWSVGLTLSVPLFAGGQNYYALQAARATAYSATYNRQATDLQLVSTLKQNYAAYVEAVEREKVTRQFMEAARTRADIARRKYDNGLLSFEEWDIIENDLVNREQAALQSQRDRVIAEATWEQSLGRSALK